MLTVHWPCNLSSKVIKSGTGHRFSSTWQLDEGAGGRGGSLRLKVPDPPVTRRGGREGDDEVDLNRIRGKSRFHAILTSLALLLLRLYQLCVPPHVPGFTRAVLSLPSPLGKRGNSRRAWGTLCGLEWLNWAERSRFGLVLLSLFHRWERVHVAEDTVYTKRNDNARHNTITSLGSLVMGTKRF